MNTITRFKTISGVTVAAVLIAAGYLAFGDAIQATEAKSAPQEKAAPKPAAVRVEEIRSRPLTLTVALTGSVEASRIAQLASPAEGPVVDVAVREGDHVAKGQVLVTLGRVEGAAALASSLREDVKKEADNFSRTKRLVESGALPAEQLDIAQANVARLEAQLVKARESTKDYVVAAPWPGVVSRVKIREGDFAAPRQPLAEIYDPASLVVRIAVPEQDAAEIAMGGVADIVLDAYPGRHFSGEISRLYPYLDPRNRTRTVEITVAGAPGLLPGMFARVFLVKRTIADALTVPTHAIVAAPGGAPSLFVVENGKAQQRKIESGAEVDGQLQIVKGVKAGDKLVVAGQEKLKDGATVQVAVRQAQRPQGSPGETSISGQAQ
jgi:membrane fusion protein (multidrug efflux system)